MIKLHHLNQSRSLRILWLLEELGQPYEVVSYQRDPKTSQAPESLKEIHPLGKSPVIELDGRIIAESAAITQILINRFASDSLRPALDTPDYEDYLQWIEFAESSLMVPLLLQVFTQRAGVNDNEFLSNYIGNEMKKALGYLDKSLQGKSFIVGDKLSGADFMLSFDLIVLNKHGQLEDYPNIAAYVQSLSALPSFQRAMELEAKYDNSK